MTLLISINLPNDYIVFFVLRSLRFHFNFFMAFQQAHWSRSLTIRVYLFIFLPAAVADGIIKSAELFFLVVISFSFWLFIVSISRFRSSFVQRKSNNFFFFFECSDRPKRTRKRLLEIKWWQTNESRNRRSGKRKIFTKRVAFRLRSIVFRVTFCQQTTDEQAVAKCFRVFGLVEKQQKLNRIAILWRRTFVVEVNDLRMLKRFRFYSVVCLFFSSSTATFAK